MSNTRCLSCIDPGYGWEETRKALREILSEIIPPMNTLLHEMFPRYKPEVIVYAVTGEIGAAYAWLAKSLMTKFGNRSRKLIKPWFISCEELDKPWDLKCRCNNTFYTIKVVSSTRAFNSTLRRRIAAESTRKENPVILSITGVFEENPSGVQEIGAAKWLDAPRTWRWLSCERRAYSRFLRILFNEARPVQLQLYREITKFYKKRLEEKRSKNQQARG